MAKKRMLDVFDRILAPMKRRLALVVVRALVDTVDDSGALQVLQVEPGADEVLEGVEHLHPYGLTSHPKKGAPVLILSVNGNSELAVALVGWSVSRPTGLAEGEVKLAHPDGSSVHLKANGDIVVTSNGKTIIDASGDIELGGGTLRTLMTEDIIAKFNQHTHLYFPGPGASTPTGAPGASTPPTTYAAADATAKTKAE